MTVDQSLSILRLPDKKVGFSSQNVFGLRYSANFKNMIDKNAQNSARYNAWYDVYLVLAQVATSPKNN